MLNSRKIEHYGLLLLVNVLKINDTKQMIPRWTHFHRFLSLSAVQIELDALKSCLNRKMELEKAVKR